MKTVVSSFLLAFHNIRSHFFHTLLSVLGIVIGVAALVSILSLIDGMEEFAKEQITKTTSLNAITISTNAYTKTNGVRVRKDTFFVLNYQDYEDLKSKLTKPCSVNYVSQFSGEVLVDQKKVGTLLYAFGSPREGITEGQIESKQNVAIVNKKFTATLTDSSHAIGKTIIFRNKTLTIQAVFDDGGDQPRIAFPLTLLTSAELHNDTPTLVVEASTVEDVSELTSQISSWLNSRFGEGNFNVWTNSARVEQATQGFLLFRIVMGLIVGISVVVGGIGIMNVLLISITERTAEIGIRKAVGAKRRDLILQFLAESVTVSVFGSMMGLILGCTWNDGGCTYRCRCDKDSVLCELYSEHTSDCECIGRSFGNHFRNISGHKGLKAGSS
ncbi:MAG: ABC transporter permease [Bacteroidota bacterium]